ncbi:hypothetical protein [Deinococcus cellulosilyticus]|nr:hypothetical protein [Deinococcus cellulosilyticus]
MDLNVVAGGATRQNPVASASQGIPDAAWGWVEDKEVQVKKWK